MKQHLEAKVFVEIFADSILLTDKHDLVALSREAWEKLKTLVIEADIKRHGEKQSAEGGKP